MKTLQNADDVTRILEEVAAEEILPRFRKLKEGDVQAKDGGELVTVADDAAEARLTTRLTELLPQSAVVGEEATARNRALLAKLAASEFAWTIDPIDGTGNFARGHRIFAVMVALVRRGEVIAAWIHEPLAGRTAVAELGAGAYLDGEKLRVNRGRREGVFNAGRFAVPEIRERVQRRRHLFQTVHPLGCAGAEYLRLASGELGYGLFSKLMPWDHAPGSLILREAGGEARFLDGEIYRADRLDSLGLLLAADMNSWKDLRGRLMEGDAGAEPPVTLPDRR